MIRTRVGYCGGRKPNPNYHDLGDHTESLQIDFDPEKITYAQLLEVFWTTHNPCQNSSNRQYMAIVFTHNEEQQRLALASRDRTAAARGTVFTEVRNYEKFWLAEDYHQKYMLRNTRAVLKEFQAIYPRDQDLMNSTAAARANGVLGGHGRRKENEAILGQLGLSSEGQEVLRDSIHRDR